MGASKKVILLIVEGLSDSSTLNPILKKIFSENNIRFHIVHGDITIANGISSKNAVIHVNDCIKKEMGISKYRKQDLIRIIHIIDTDGAFISDKDIIYSNVNEISYNDSSIKTSKVDQIINRNKTKREVVERLYKTGKVHNTPYEIYYFSRNMEHVLHNESGNLTDDEKGRKADEFVDTYENDIDSFINFITKSDFAVDGDFNTTWDFILKNNNSLKRHSNIHLMLRDNPRGKIK